MAEGSTVTFSKQPSCDAPLA